MEKIDWKQELLDSQRFNKKEEKLLKFGAKSIAQSWWLQSLYVRWKKLKGLNQKNLKASYDMEKSVVESDLIVQDWNVDDIKYTEIETVDVIKPKPIKEEHSDWRDDLGEDWQKVNRKDKTDGLSKKAVKAYRRENPGSKLKTAVTKDPKKLKKGSKDAKRRLSFCRRMKGMKKRLTSAKTARDPDSRINKALRRWNC